MRPLCVAMSRVTNGRFRFAISIKIGEDTGGNSSRKKEEEKKQLETPLVISPANVSRLDCHLSPPVVSRRSGGLAAGSSSAWNRGFKKRPSPRVISKHARRVFVGSINIHPYMYTRITHTYIDNNYIPVGGYIDGAFRTRNDNSWWTDRKKRRHFPRRSPPPRGK